MSGRDAARAAARALGIQLANYDIADVTTAFESMTIEQRTNADIFIERIVAAQTARLETEQRLQIRATGLSGQINHLIALTGLPLDDWRILQATCQVTDDAATQERIAKMVDACKYQGFDPVATLKKLIGLWKVGDRVAEAQRFRLTFNGPAGEEGWEYTSKESLIDDMYFMVTVFLNRGAVVGKILKKSNKEFVNVMKMLCAKYTVKVEERGRGRRAEALSPEVITLPRIAAAYPAITCDLFDRGHGRSLANRGIFPPEVPNVFFSPMFASVVTRVVRVQGVQQNIHPQLMWLAILVDNVLHQRDRPTPLDLIWTYHLAAFNSNILEPSERQRLCIKWEVVVGNPPTFVESLTGMRERAKEEIRRLRPHERLDELIREMDSVF